VRLLADTHVVLWALLRPKELDRRAARALRAASNEVFASAASLWEIAIKEGLGKLRLPGPPAEWLPEALERTGFETLPIAGAHALAAGALPPHHRDPFDRMLVAQAVAEGLTVVTRDVRFAAYGVAVLPA
jgi:PIN domain nuclease of toxin-antitoxin system